MTHYEITYKQKDPRLGELLINSFENKEEMDKYWEENNFNIKEYVKLKVVTTVIK